MMTSSYIEIVSIFWNEADNLFSIYNENNFKHDKNDSYNTAIQHFHSNKNHSNAILYDYDKYLTYILVHYYFWCEIRWLLSTKLTKPTSRDFNLLIIL